MSFEVKQQSISLPYPPYALSFDPDGSHLLAVAGGGGRGRNGVKNFVSVYDLSSPAEDPDPVAEYQLGAGHDNPTTVAVLARSGSRPDGVGSDRPGELAVLVGANGTEDDCDRGVNASLRSFGLVRPASGGENKSMGGKDVLAERGLKNRQNRVDGGGINKVADKPENEAESDDRTENASLVSQPAVKLFTTPAKRTDRLDSYQRVLAVSRPAIGVTSRGRIGAAASALSGPKNEIAVFDADAAATVNRGQDPVIQLCEINGGAEVDDIDIIELKGQADDDARTGTFRLLATCGHELYLATLKHRFSDSNAPSKPARHSPAAAVFRPVYSTVLTGSPKTRQSVRFARFVTDEIAVLMTNSADRRGSELTILSIRPEGDDDNAATTTVKLIHRHRMPAHLGNWVSVAICPLGRDDRTGEMQIGIAAGFSSEAVGVFAANMRRDVLVRSVRTIATWTDLRQGTVTAVGLSPAHDRARLAVGTISRVVTVYYLPVSVVESGSSGSRLKLVPQPTHRILSSFVFLLMALIALLAGVAVQTDIAASMPVAIANSATGIRLLQPIENMQAIVQRRPARMVGAAVEQDRPVEVSLFKEKRKLRIPRRIVEIAAFLNSPSPSKQHQKRRNLHHPGTEQMRENAQDDDSGRQRKQPIQSSTSPDSYADEVAKLLEEAPPGAFMLLKGVPVGLGLESEALAGSLGPVAGKVVDQALGRPADEDAGDGNDHDAHPAADKSRAKMKTMADGKVVKRAAAASQPRARLWQELSGQEQAEWKGRLERDGRWDPADGDAVLDRIVVG